MIVYIFNSYFPNAAGFGLRCKKSIDELSLVDTVTIYCRGYKKNEPDTYSNNKKIHIYRFFSHVALIENPSAYSSIMYEIYRNVSIFFSFSWGLCMLLFRLRDHHEVKLYVVSSPLTIPFFSYLFSLVWGVKPFVLEFHDLEPELGIHIKKLNPSSMVVKIEYYLEKFLSKRYQKIIVTSESQAQVLAKRADIKLSKICAIPNTVAEPVMIPISNGTLYKKYGLSSHDFILGYISILTYEYTYSGLLDLLHNFSKFTKPIPNIKLVIVGDGDSLQKIKDEVKKLGIEHSVIFTGLLTDISGITSIFNAGIIPWLHDSMTEMLLPTKVFDYMAAKKVVIAPNFGEFSKVITNAVNGYLYYDILELVAILVSLSNNKNLQKQIGQNGYKMYKEGYSIEKSAKKLTKFLSL